MLPLKYYGTSTYTKYVCVIIFLFICHSHLYVVFFILRGLLTPYVTVVAIEKAVPPPVSNIHRNTHTPAPLSQLLSADVINWPFWYLSKTAGFLLSLFIPLYDKERIYLVHFFLKLIIILSINLRVCVLKAEVLKNP